MSRQDSEKDMVVLSAKLPPDLREQVEQYGDDLGIKKSPAARRLIRAGLDAEQQSSYSTLSTLLLFIGAVLAAAAYADAGQTAGLIGLGAIAVAIILSHEPTVERLQALRDEIREW